MTTSKYLAPAALLIGVAIGGIFGYMNGTEASRQKHQTKEIAVGNFSGTNPMSNDVATTSYGGNLKVWLRQPKVIHAYYAGQRILEGDRTNDMWIPAEDARRLEKLGIRLDKDNSVSLPLRYKWPEDKTEGAQK